MAAAVKEATKQQDETHREGSPHGVLQVHPWRRCVYSAVCRATQHDGAEFSRDDEEVLVGAVRAVCVCVCVCVCVSSVTVFPLPSTTGFCTLCEMASDAEPVSVECSLCLVCVWTHWWGVCLVVCVVQGVVDPRAVFAAARARPKSNSVFPREVTGVLEEWFIEVQKGLGVVAVSVCMIVCVFSFSTGSTRT